MTTLELMADGLSAAVWYLLGRHFTNKRPKELLCLHTESRVLPRTRPKQILNLKCAAKRDMFCRDGRCSFHCKKTCKCEESLE